MSRRVDPIAGSVMQPVGEVLSQRGLLWIHASAHTCSLPTAAVLEELITPADYLRLLLRREGLALLTLGYAGGEPDAPALYL